MRVSAENELYEAAELYGTPVLYTENRVEEATVPAGWYGYELRGNGEKGEQPVTLEKRVAANFAGTILSPVRIPFAKGEAALRVAGKLKMLGLYVKMREAGPDHARVSGQSVSSILQPQVPVSAVGGSV